MLGGQLNTVEQLFAGAGDGLMGHSLEERRAFNPNGGMPAPMLERRGTAEGSIQYTGSGTQGQNNNQAEGGNAGSEGDATEDDSKSARAKCVTKMAAS